MCAAGGAVGDSGEVQCCGAAVVADEQRFADGEARRAGDAGQEHGVSLYQTLIGAWPITLDRAQDYMLKAVREAKLQTTWTANNTQFEEALRVY